MYESNFEKFDLLAVQECSFLFHNYTDIYNKLLKNELNIDNESSILPLSDLNNVEANMFPSIEAQNEKIDKNLLRFLTVKVKTLDLETDYFKKNDLFFFDLTKFIYF